MESDDVKFLRDQVQRLTAILADYQERYNIPANALQESMHDAGDVPDLPWNTDKTFLSPLLTEYDTNIQLLRKQIEAYRKEKQDLKNEIDELVTENTKLTRLLKDTTARQMETLLPGEGVSSAEGSEAHVINNLQAQLRMALQEKESTQEMLQTTLREVERLERELRNAQMNPRLQSLETQAHQIKDEYVRSVGDMNSQILQLQDELKATKNELRVANIQVVELRSTLEDLRSEMILKEKQRSIHDGSRTVLDQHVKELHHQISDIQTKLSASHSQVEQLQQDKGQVEQRLVEVLKRNADAENRSREAVLRASENHQLVETSIFERDQAHIREKQAKDEVERLQDVISRLVDEAGARTRQEVDNVKKTCNQSLTKLMDQLQRLELENSERQAELDRAVREKRAAESELERIYQEGILQGSKENNEYNQLTLRACNAERARDDAVMKVDSLTNQLRRLEMTYKQEKSQLTSELDSIKDRHSLTNQELSGANDDRVHFMEKVDDLKQQIHKIQVERDTVQRSSTKQVYALQHSLQMKEKEYEAKLQALEDGHRQQLSELREMLTAQQRVTAKWKEECNVATQKMESRVTESRSELSREKRRIEELTKLLRDSRNKNIETETKLANYSRNLQVLEGKIMDSRSRNNIYPSQVMRELKTTKGLSLVEARKQQKRELEQNLRDSISAYRITGSESN